MKSLQFVEVLVAKVSDVLHPIAQINEHVVVGTNSEIDSPRYSGFFDQPRRGFEAEIEGIARWGDVSRKRSICMFNVNSLGPLPAVFSSRINFRMSISKGLHIYALLISHDGHCGVK